MITHAKGVKKRRKVKLFVDSPRPVAIVSFEIQFMFTTNETAANAFAKFTINFSQVFGRFQNINQLIVNAPNGCVEVVRINFRRKRLVSFELHLHLSFNLVFPFRKNFSCIVPKSPPRDLKVFSLFRVFAAIFGSLLLTYPN